MKRLIIIVEGQTEEEFVKEVLAPYFHRYELYSIIPIKIATSKVSKGGFVNYAHLYNDANGYLREPDTIVTMFVDYFRIPTSVPQYNNCITNNALVDDKINCLEQAIASSINNPNFIPYIQKHEFESLLFANNDGFQSLYDSSIFNQTLSVINNYPNPEDINSGANTAPSKRLYDIIGNYDKVADGNMIALEIGIDNILSNCPRFRDWVNLLIQRLQAP